MQCPDMAHMATTFSLTTATEWFDIFLAALDCYCWVFGQGLLKPDKLLIGGALLTWGLCVQTRICTVDAENL